MAMAGKQAAGDGLPTNLAGMSKNQLHDIMSQMKTLIEQNHQQARDILIQNPQLTRALFQAQIMLGMVRPPQAVPSIHPPVSQHHQQSVQPPQQSHVQATNPLPTQVGLQDQPSASQTQASARKQHQNQSAMPISSASLSPVNIQSQPMHSLPLQMPQQPKGLMNPTVTPMSLPQSSELSNITPPLPHHSSSQPPSLHQPQMPTASSHLQPPLQSSGHPHMPLQPPLQSSGHPHMPLQPPLPPQSRQSSIPSFHHQFAPQTGPNVGFQHHGAPQHPSQSMFHSGTKPPASVGPSFPQVQPPLPSQPPPQSAYQAGGAHLRSEFNSQVGNSMQVDRGSWMPVPPENSPLTQLQGPAAAAAAVPGQMGPGNQPPRPSSLSPEMEKALLQQVMSLTPEQINLLPPEQRNQVLQLQQILRQ